MSEYGNLQYEVLDRFKERRDPTGRNVHPSPLDGTSFCQADLYEIGKDSQGTPNRAQVAAFMRDPSFLTLHGEADCTHALREMARGPLKIGRIA